MLGGAAALVVAVVVVVTVLVLGASHPERATPARPRGAVTARVAPGPVVEGEALPGFTVPGLDGGGVSLEALRGRPVIVNFWASWCNPCRKEFPLLRDALRRHRSQHLSVIGLSFRDIPSDGRAFARSQHATWPLGRDDRGVVAQAYGVAAVPQTFFVDASGVLRSRVFGLGSRADLDREIRKILPPGG
ncbi:MAG: TlpA disulfide reductase family protein [Actinomycetes bacterium]